ncbi:MAG: zincin-like metallopeptidase domain-containing protein [Thiobacillus sp.]
MAFENRAFNIDQIEGLPAHFYAKAAPRLNPDQRLAHAESFFAALGAEIRHGGNRAFYCPSTDHVQMPDFVSFKSAESYYATLAHECTHYAVSRIMPHGLRGGLDFRGPAMRRFGIIWCEKRAGRAARRNAFNAIGAVHLSLRRPAWPHVPRRG